METWSQRESAKKPNYELASFKKPETQLLFVLNFKCYLDLKVKEHGDLRLQRWIVIEICVYLVCIEHLSLAEKREKGPL